MKTAAPIQVAFRLLAIGITLVLYKSCPDENSWKAVVSSLGLGHYLLSVMYASDQIVRLAKSPTLFWFFSLIVGAGAALYFIGFPIVILFAVHHVFNETYLSGPLSSRREDVMLRTSAIFLHFSVYFAILWHYPVINLIPRSALYLVCALSVVSFLGVLFLTKRREGPRVLLSSSILEILALAVLAASFWWTIPFLAIICYHVVLWAFVPLPHLAKKGMPAVRRYVFETIIITGIFLLISPLGFEPYVIVDSHYFKQFLFWSVIHIMASFALSRSQPRWITRWFWPAGPVARAAAQT